MEINSEVIVSNSRSPFRGRRGVVVPTQGDRYNNIVDIWIKLHPVPICKWYAAKPAQTTPFFPFELVDISGVDL